MGAVGVNGAASALASIWFSGPLQHGVDGAAILCID